MNPYLQVFTEAAHTASIIPLASEAAFSAMKSFGGYNMPPAAIIAVLGAMVGHIFNWYFGWFLFNFEHKAKIRIDPHHYERARSLFHKYGIFLLLLAWAPLCNFIVVASGFLGVRFKTALPLILAGLALHYGLALL